MKVTITLVCLFLAQGAITSQASPFVRCDAGTKSQCESGSEITSWEMCLAAAKALGLKWRSGYKAASWPNVSPGCTWDSVGQVKLVFNTNSGGSLHACKSHACFNPLCLKGPCTQPTAEAPTEASTDKVEECDEQARFDIMMCKSYMCTECTQSYCMEKCQDTQNDFPTCRCREWARARKSFSGGDFAGKGKFGDAGDYASASAFLSLGIKGDA